MTKKDGCHPDVWTNLACCYFFLGMYPDSDAACQKGQYTLIYRSDDGKEIKASRTLLQYLTEKGRRSFKDTSTVSDRERSQKNHYTG